MQSQLSAQPLAEFIRREIEAKGPVTVEQFMAWALYHPEHGYYMTGPNIGPRGDFTTSPEASPAFGKLLTRHVADVDALLEYPPAFDIVECGPGRGTLAAHLLEELEAKQPSLYRRSRYWLVEISPSLTQAQKELLVPKYGDRCRWAADLEAIPHAIEGALIANEFIDAFPVHVIENRDGVLMEQYVGNGEEAGFRIYLDKPSDPALIDFLMGYEIDLQPGEQVEVNLAMQQWLHSLGRKLERGVAAIFDYGDTAPGRYSEARRQGTLLGYFGGSVTSDITAHPGKQDLTALVDFTALKDAAEAAGLTQVCLTRQAHFLLGLGLGEPSATEAEIGRTPDINAILEYRRGMQALVSMEGLGRFHVSLLSKGIDPERARANLSGLRYSSL
ncbi:MAG TPA: SAM-dependent methyltransferase [Chloroflexia bacterium]|nr:SAM-dependent methyltransferase [Chloroflexia bacterium]